MAKVLIVDDSKLIRFNTKKILEELGHEVVGLAQDGLEGYEMYKEFIPDLVMMDINMPRMDGITSVKKIINEFPGAIIMMATAEGEGNRQLLYDCIEEGASDFIDKPVEKDKLQKKVGKLLKL